MTYGIIETQYGRHLLLREPDAHVVCSCPSEVAKGPADLMGLLKDIEWKVESRRREAQNAVS